MKRQDFFNELVASAPASDVNAAKKATVARLTQLLMKDVNAMKAVVKVDANWKDLTPLVPDAAEREKLRNEITGRIVAGENQIASQPFDF